MSLGSSNWWDGVANYQDNPVGGAYWELRNQELCFSHVKSEIATLYLRGMC